MNLRDCELICTKIFRRFRIYEIPMYAVSIALDALDKSDEDFPDELIIKHPSEFLLDTFNLIHCIDIVWAPNC